MNIRLITALALLAGAAVAHAADPAASAPDNAIQRGANKAAAVVKPPLEKAESKAADATYNAGESVGKGIKKGGEAVGRGAEKTGAAIKRGATKTKNAAKKGAKKVEAAVTPASAPN